MALAIPHRTENIPVLAAGYGCGFEPQPVQIFDFCRTPRLDDNVSLTSQVTRTVHRKPGSEPRGSGRSAHQISPQLTISTSCPLQEFSTGRNAKPDQVLLALQCRFH